ncbi:MAG: BTB/POZ protein [Piptocephalis tieghemiana]|nr:MAG: BTB/POZ protein [Piptocephalis tieghemiana]
MDDPVKDLTTWLERVDLPLPQKASFSTDNHPGTPTVVREPSESDSEAPSQSEPESLLTLNVGGTRFYTRASTLAAYPDTLLGSMFSPENKDLLQPLPSGEYFFDRNPRVFPIILDFYRSGIMDIFRPYNRADGTSGSLGLVEIRLELDFFQIPESTWSGSVSRTLHANAASRVSNFVDALLEIVSVHLDNFIDIVVIHFGRGKEHDEPVLRNVNRSVEARCAQLLERCYCGFRLLSDEKLQQTVIEVAKKRFPPLRFTIQIIRHELVVLCLSGYLDVNELRSHLYLDPM